MPPKHVPLTEDAARQMTRGELAERVEEDQKRWMAKGTRMTAADRAEERENMRILRLFVDLDVGFADVMAALEGDRAGPRYWDTRPCDDDPE